MPGNKSVNDADLRQFLNDYLARGDTPVSDFVHSYSALMPDGETSDPAAIYDFLAAARTVLELPDDTDTMHGRGHW